MDGVQVRHENDRRAPGLVEVTEQVQRAPDAHPSLKRAKRRLLDRGSVRERVGERDAELEHVGACVGRGVEEVEALVPRGEPRAHVGDQDGLFLHLSLGEGRSDAQAT